MTHRQVTPAGLRHLTQWEGAVAKVYRDVARLPTIGVGHLLTPSELASGKLYIKGEVVRYANGLTPQQMDDLLDQDLDVTESAVHYALWQPGDLYSHEFDMLVSLAFNIGIGAFNDSTLLKRVNTEQYEEVPDQFKRWVYSGGRKIQGLINRRKAEAHVWSNGYA